MIAMLKRLKTMKDLLWAAGIGLAVLALLVGLIAATFTPYHGDRERPVMQLKSEKPEKSAAEETAAPVKRGEGLQADGTLHPLVQTADAGEEYLDSLTILCDSSIASLRAAGLCAASVWSSETGSLPMSEADSWTIRYPGDGSQIGPASAALIAKPKVLIIAVGSDGLADLTKEKFTQSYEALIRGIANASPKTTIVCLSETSLRHYFEITDQAKFDLVKGNISFGSNDKIDYTEKNGEIYFELKDIAAAELDNLCTLSIGGNSYLYSVVDYIKACLLSEKTSDNMKELSAALYRCNQAANTYFDSQGGN